MDKKDILQCLGDLLFNDIFVNEKAVELQALNPEGFRLLINEMIEREDFSEETFYELYEQYIENDKLCYIGEYQYLASKSLVPTKDIDGCVFDGSEYEEAIFGLELDDYPSYINYDRPYFIIDVEEIDDKLEEKELTVEQKDILTLLQAYQSNMDGTCLFAVLELITENPKLIDLIPNTHATILGIDSLTSGASFNKFSNHELIDLLESIPGAYLTYSGFHNPQLDEMDELLDRVKMNIEKFKTEEIYNLPTRK